MALHYRGGPIHLANGAQRQEISVKYLEQIIMPLKKAHCIYSVVLANTHQPVSTVSFGKRRRRLCLTN
jgi:hypothetical protein